ncbi:MAG: hypothetical protein QW244_01390 [Candidatus Pacearchaeota archaeon]
MAVKDKGKAIRAILIFEVIGRPKDFVENVMSVFLDKIKEHKDVELIRKQILPAQPMKQAKNLFSLVAECEFYFKDLEVLLGFMIDTMPASIEIIEPTSLTLDLPKINAFINDYLTKIHQYDDVYKKFKLERDILLKKIAELEKKISEGKEKK